MEQVKEIKKSQTYELPKYYGDTKIVLLPRDVYWLFAYWEIGEQTKQQLKNDFGDDIFDKSQPMLRIYDVTDIEFDGHNANKFFDININFAADNWYIKIDIPNRTWCVDLGLKLSSGVFITIARSNILKMPKYGVSSVTDEKWAVVEREFGRLLELSGIQHIGKGSFDISKLLKERWQEMLYISSMLNLPGSVRPVSSFRIEKQQEEIPVLEQQREFFLKANTEIIIYGSTQPSAELKFQNKPIKLSPEGTFSIKLSLDDGITEFPIEATSTKGDNKKIKFIITKETTNG